MYVRACVCEFACVFINVCMYLYIFSSFLLLACMKKYIFIKYITYFSWKYETKFPSDYKDLKDLKQATLWYTCGFKGKMRGDCFRMNVSLKGQPSTLS